MLIFVFVNIISLAVAMWVFYDSQKRGSTVWRSLLWAVGVFFILVVFLPLYLAGRKKKDRVRAAAREAPTSSSSSLCFYCRQTYEGNPTVCPHCGQNLNIN